MSEDRRVQNEDDAQAGLLDFVYKVPFGMQAAVLAGALVAVPGVIGAITIFGGWGSTCCPPVID